MIFLTHENKLISPLLLDGPVVYAAYLKTEHSDENVNSGRLVKPIRKLPHSGTELPEQKLYKVYISIQSLEGVTIPDYAGNWKSVPPRKAQYLL